MLQPIIKIAALSDNLLDLLFNFTNVDILDDISGFDHKICNIYIWNMSILGSQNKQMFFYLFIKFSISTSTCV